MNTISENNILFDDAALLENSLGQGYFSAASKTYSPDCDCTSYSPPHDDEDINTTKGPGTDLQSL